MHSCSLTSHSHPAEMSSPQGSRAKGKAHWQLYVRFLVMLTTFKYMVVEFNFSWLSSLGGWSLYMDPLHLNLKVQYTLKVEPRCTTDPAVDQMAQDFSPERRYDDCMLNMEQMKMILMQRHHFTNINCIKYCTIRSHWENKSNNESMSVLTKTCHVHSSNFSKQYEENYVKM